MMPLPKFDMPNFAPDWEWLITGGRTTLSTNRDSDNESVMSRLAIRDAMQILGITYFFRGTQIKNSGNKMVQEKIESNPVREIPT